MLEGQFQVADLGVLESSDAVVADQDVVRGPLVAELEALADAADVDTRGWWEHEM